MRNRHYRMLLSGLIICAVVVAGMAKFGSAAGKGHPSLWAGVNSSQGGNQKNLANAKLGGTQGFSSRDQLAPLAPEAVFSNPAPITINAVGAATPYPSNIPVNGIAGNITKVTLTLTGLSHTFVEDVDMMVVAPNGAKFVFFGDVGGQASGAQTSVNLTLDDAAASQLPTNAPLTTGTFRPTSDNPTGDTFPAPAPAPTAGTDFAAPEGTATFANHFNGLTPAQSNGTWSLYVVDDSGGDSGSISGGWALNITEATSVGQLIISEFRLRGPSGANDEFIELYNSKFGTLTTQSADGSGGLAVVASDGTARCVVPNGTVIPQFGHFLCANSVGYSISGYPAGNGTTATANLTYTTDIPDNAGIAIFNNSTGGASFSTANRLDAVGSTSEANTTYKEGTGYPALTASAIEYSFFRKIDMTTGSPTDTGNNATDFMFADTAATSTAAGQRLGAPGPENLSSPPSRGLTIFTYWVDTGCTGVGSPTSACSLARDATSDPANNSTFGTISVRRKIINDTGAAVTRLRYRIVDLTTFPAPAGTADLRVRTSNTFTANLSGGGTTSIQGTTLETPPSQPMGGGFNSTLSSVPLGSPLAQGDSINVQFQCGVQQLGDFRFAIIIEALPTGSARANTNQPFGDDGPVMVAAGHISAATAADASITGSVADMNGNALEGTVIRLTGTQNRVGITNANGSFAFDKVETNGFYAVTPSRANFGFSPGSRSFSQLGNNTEAAFTAVPSADTDNPLNTAEYFVRQQYVDLLGREPDEGGFNYWSDQILACGNSASCVNQRRRDVAAAFFIEQEFQLTGSFIYNLYQGGLARRPVFTEYSADRQQVVGGANLEARKQAFAEAFVARAEFANRYQGNSTAASFVDALLTNVQQATGVDLSSQRSSLITRYNAGSSQSQSRSFVLRTLTESTDVRNATYNAAFVLTEYFGYLRRNPDQAGYDFWLNVLNTSDANNYRGMVCSFITSTEYQRRFSNVVSHSNSECGSQ